MDCDRFAIGLTPFERIVRGPTYLASGDRSGARPCTAYVLPFTCRSSLVTGRYPSSSLRGAIAGSNRSEDPGHQRENDEARETQPGQGIRYLGWARGERPSSLLVLRFRGFR